MPLVMGLEKASYWQLLIRVMRLMIEIGCVDINTKVSLLSSNSAMPRQGHLEVALYIMDYLKLRHNFRIVLMHPIPMLIIVFFQNVIGKTSMRAQWELFYPMDNC